MLVQAQAWFPYSQSRMVLFLIGWNVSTGTGLVSCFVLDLENIYTRVIGYVHHQHRLGFDRLSVVTKIKYSKIIVGAHSLLRTFPQ